MVDIFCKNCGTTKSFVEGTSLKSIATEFGFNEPYKIVSARVNNVSEGLTYNKKTYFQGILLHYREG